MKNAKKSMFITTILMVAVLIVAVSTATFAWYTAANNATASQATLTAAESSAANIAVGWDASASGSTITFDADAVVVNPMCPTAVPTLGMEYSALTFNTQTLNSAGKFNGNGITTAEQVTPWTVNDGADENAKTSFFVINKNVNETATVTMSFVPTNTSANNSKLVVAVFGKQGEDQNAKLLGVFCNVAEGFVAGAILNDKLPLTVDDEEGCLTLVTSSSQDTPIKSSITLDLAKNGATGHYVEISVKAWMDGSALGQETAGKDATFKFEFTAQS